MKILCWNVNSIRTRLEQLYAVIAEHQPDILLLQELKCEEAKFPFEELADLNYNYAISGQKSYNGVAIFSKFRLEEQRNNFPNNPCPEQARFIEACINNPQLGFVRLISIYVPNGGEVGSDKFKLKLEFLDAFRNYLADLKNNDEKIIIAGDYNVAPYDIDVYAPTKLAHSTCFTLTERQKMRSILNDDWLDLYRLLQPTTSEFSWWDYRGNSYEHNHGMRIDFILSNSLAADQVKKVTIDTAKRGNSRASDHAPVVAEF